jgi:hypothetical protein
MHERIGKKTGAKIEYQDANGEKIEYSGDHQRKHPSIHGDDVSHAEKQDRETLEAEMISADVLYYRRTYWELYDRFCF